MKVSQPSSGSSNTNTSLQTESPLSAIAAKSTEEMSQSDPRFRPIVSVRDHLLDLLKVGSLDNLNIIQGVFEKQGLPMKHINNLRSLKADFKNQPLSAEDHSQLKNATEQVRADIAALNLPTTESRLPEQPPSSMNSNTN